MLTVPDSLVFLRGQVAFMRERGWRISVITSPGPTLDAFGREQGVDVYGATMPRRISPAQDLISLGRLTARIRVLAPDLVHSHTPKGGLLGTMAATIARVPARIYHMRGLPMLTTTGNQRRILTATERTSCALATRVIANSRSLRDIAIAERLCAPSKIEVLGAGSGNGVDCDVRFNPDTLAPGARDTFRRTLGIAPSDFVLGFLGRFVRDKGIIELSEAWTKLRSEHPNAHLVLGGIFEERDAVPPATREMLEHDPRVHLLGFYDDTPAFLSAIDVLTLPTYREGFPNVLLEAAAMRVPVVATRVTGCVDAVVDDETGLLVPAASATDLAAAIARYIADPERRVAHGRAARDRVVREFRRERLWTELERVYEELVP